MEVLFVLLLSQRVYKNVIDEYNHKLIKIRTEDTIHQVHESCRSVRQSKRHYKKLVVPVTRTKGSLWDVLLANPQLVIS